MKIYVNLKGESTAVFPKNDSGPLHQNVGRGLRYGGVPRS